MGTRTSSQCYYCGDRAEGYEHAPPRLLFKAFCCDSITVPACRRHNSEKSGDDQAVVYAMLQSLAASSGVWPQSETVKRAIKAAASGFGTTRRRTFLIHMFDDSAPEEFSEFPRVSYVYSAERIEEWHRQLTAALVYDGLGRFDRAISWTQAESFAPSFVECSAPQPLPLGYVLSVMYANRAVETELAGMDWIEGWSAHPRPYPSDIYRFWMVFSSNLVVFRHRFFDAFDWYVGFRASRQTARALERRAMRPQRRARPAT